MKTCCCCFPVKTGSLILFIIYLLSGLYIAISSIPIASQDTAGSSISTFIIVCLFNLMLASVAAAGIYGILREKPILLIPYLAFQIVYIILEIILMIIIAPRKPNDESITLGLVLGVSLKQYYYEENGIASVKFGLILSVVLNCYFIFVICSYYNELKQQTKQRRNPGSA